MRLTRSDQDAKDGHTREAEERTDRGVGGNFHPFFLVDAQDPGASSGLTATEELVQVDRSFRPEDVRTLPRFRQSQDALNDQLARLYDVANQLGLYDAASFLSRRF